MRRTLVGAVAVLVAAPALAVVSVATAPSSAPSVARCAEEDGSTPGQAFPCVWDGGTNGRGLTYVLPYPAGAS